MGPRGSKLNKIVDVAFMDRNLDVSANLDYNKLNLEIHGCVNHSYKNPGHENLATMTSATRSLLMRSSASGSSVSGTSATRTLLLTTSTMGAVATCNT